MYPSLPRKYDDGYNNVVWAEAQATFQAGLVREVTTKLNAFLTESGVPNMDQDDVLHMDNLKGFAVPRNTIEARVVPNPMRYNNLAAQTRRRAYA